MHIHTHYDNLQLSQNASDAEIRQAYRRLSKRYHPDLNDDPDAHRIMQLVNRAYEVLSDPVSRAEHDRWIAAQYRRRFELAVPRPQSITYYTTEIHEDNHRKLLHKRLLAGLMVISLLMMAVVGWQSWGWLKRNGVVGDAPAVQAAAPVPQTIQININTGEAASADTVVSNSGYVRPETAPNGSPFPKDSGYIQGYPVITGMGQSIIIADNVRNSSDVFGQLYEKNSQHALRTFFLNERSQLELKQLDAGEYFIRYHQLDDGEYLDSESISITRSGERATIYLQRGKAPKSE